MAGKLAEYSKSKSGDATIFEVTAAERTTLQNFGPYLIGGAVGLLGLTLLMPPFTIFGLGILVGAYFITRHMQKKTAYSGGRSKFTFKVSPNGIEVDGKRFTKDDIQFVSINDKYDPISMPADRTGLCNALVVISEGKATSLAENMDNTTALGLSHDVNKILGG